jgi:hypothetical protein
MTLAELAAQVNGQTTSTPTPADPDDLLEVFEPGEYLRNHTPQKPKSGASLAGAALGRMFKKG